MTLQNINEILEILNNFSILIIAISAIYGVYQYRLNVKNSKAEIIHKLFQPILTSEKLNNFREKITRIVTNRHNTNAFRNDLLQRLDSSIENEDKKMARMYGNYLSQLFYYIENKLISPKDTLKVYGGLIHEYYLFKRLMVEEYPDATVHSIFPHLPTKLESKVKNIKLELS